MTVGIVVRMVYRRMNLIAFDLEERMRTLAVGMKRRRIDLVVADRIDRLGIRPTVFHLEEMVVFHRKQGLGGMESSRMAVGTLVDILHIVF